MSDASINPTRYLYHLKLQDKTISFLLLELFFIDCSNEKLGTNQDYCSVVLHFRSGYKLELILSEASFDDLKKAWGFFYNW